MAYRGKRPNHIKSVSTMRDKPGAVLVETNNGSRYLIYGRENTAPLKPGTMPALGDHVWCYNRFAWVGGEVQGERLHGSEIMPAKGALLWQDSPDKFGVRLYEHKGRYTVQYGYQHRAGLTYDQAAHEIGYAVMHGHHNES
jgi:hypothetical protein